MVSAIVLAAGMSTRMGARNKLLLPIGNTTFIGNIVDAALKADVGEVIVVLGHQKEKVRKAIGDRDVIFVENPAYESGMTSSIQAGVKTVSDNAAGFMICLSDMPQVTTEDLNVLITTFNKASLLSKIFIPTFKSQRGNPVIFSSLFREKILMHPEPNGCRGIIQQHASSVVEVKMPNNHILKDVDTEADYLNLE